MIQTMSAMTSMMVTTSTRSSASHRYSQSSIRLGQTIRDSYEDIPSNVSLRAYDTSRLMGMITEVTSTSSPADSYHP